MKREISKSKLNNIIHELDFYTEEQLITQEQRENIINSYETKESLNFIKILITLGAILIGLSILTLVASNWAYLSKPIKLAVIALGYLGFMFAGYFTEKSLPKTSRGLYYIASITFGAGIFLIGQMFNLGGEFTEAFLLWAIGIIPLGIYLKDKWLILVSLLFVSIYMTQPESSFILIALFASIFYLINEKLFKSKLVFFLTNLFMLYVLLIKTVETLDSALYSTLIFLAIGLIMYYLLVRIKQLSFYQGILKFQGFFVIGISGLFLTFEQVWNDTMLDLSSNIPWNIIFAVIYILYLLFYSKLGNLYALLFIGIAIFRFYFDGMYDFLPKSIFFLIGGIIFIAFGYYFEKQRRGKNE